MIGLLPNFSVETIVFLKDALVQNTEKFKSLGYHNVHQDANISIFKQTGNKAE